MLNACCNLYNALHSGDINTRKALDVQNNDSSTGFWQKSQSQIKPEHFYKSNILLPVRFLVQTETYHGFNRNFVKAIKLNYSGTFVSHKSLRNDTKLNLI